MSVSGSEINYIKNLSNLVSVSVVTLRRIIWYHKMSTAMTFGQKQFIPTPPDKGSFPLDHEGVCKNSMKRYLNCLFENNSNNSFCRTEAKDYLACRMEHNLMTKEKWSKLGFPEEDEQLKEDKK